MLVDLAKTDHCPEFNADVCIVGAGAAGISLARQLMQAGKRVLLLESGGLDFENETQSLYEGDNVGMPYYDLVDARLRFFGGTTNIWGGRCVPLDPIDFQHRNWVPHSGWPISSKDLDRHYRAAHDQLQLGDYSYHDDLWREATQAPPALDPKLLQTRFWRFDTIKERFSAKRCVDLIQSDLVMLLIHANVTKLHAHNDGNHINQISLSSVAGHSHILRAKTYVLACGGLENPRLLLASRDVENAGIGNRFDQVGRYFMEHQHGRAGQVHTDNPYQTWSIFRKFQPKKAAPPLAPTLVASAAMQERYSILNTALTFKLQRDPKHGLLLNDRLYRSLKHQLPPERHARKIWQAYRSARGWIQTNIRPALERLRSRHNTRNLYLMVRAEQAPNPNSRVTLGDEKDALGMPKIKLDWQLSWQDKATVSALCEICDKEFRRLGIGHVEPADWLSERSNQWPVDPTVSKHPIGGYHHMGTTRMSADPRYGVVDDQCGVHNYDNLFIAGSSTFATGGWANPTLTLLALTHRLGEHLLHR